jgi:subtilisin family serine protease
MNILARSLAVPIILALSFGPGATAGPEAEHVADEILITVRDGLDDAASHELIEVVGHEVVKRFRFATNPHSKLNRCYLVRIPPGSSVDEALKAARNTPGVEAAQPNYIYRALDAPDDPYYDLQWGHKNTGDNSAYEVYGLRGPDPRVSGADMDTEDAVAIWDGITFEPITVGVIDTGVDLDHPDLLPSLWTNPDELPDDGVDNDSNGYPDDVHGWDFAYDDNDPDEVDGHGTHVAGVIGALRNNAQGVAGVAPNVRIMPLRFLDDGGAGTTADAIDAISYAVDKGARVLNNSWGGGPWEEALYTAIADARDAGVLFVAAAGNEGTDNDVTPHYPSSYPLQNIIVVGASTPWRDMADLSNYGDESVHIFAPGDEIISTNPADGNPGFPETIYQLSYNVAGYDGAASWGGTSMATPYVAGAGAILYGLGEELWPATWSGMTPVERMTAVRERILTRAEHWA